MTLAATIRTNPHWLPQNDPDCLSDVPGEDGWPLVGTTVRMLNDPPRFVQRMHDTYGNVYRSKNFGGRLVTLLGPDANEFVLFDRDKIFSSEQGWGSVLDLVFPRGLMLMDFEKHRADRRILSTAFKPEPMRLYADALNDGVAARTGAWLGRSFAFYPAAKALTLDLAATSFLGIPFGDEAERINQAFIDMLAASVAVVRVPLPGTAMGRGVAARSYLVRHFREIIPARRAGDAQDIFSQICRATDERGRLLEDSQIIDHINFLLMAAHDTTTSTVSTMAMLLGRHVDWQDRLRDEMIGLGLGGGPLPHDRLGELILTEYVMKEALRLMPPVPSIPRRALKAFSFAGYEFSAGTFVGLQTGFTHRMAEHWPDPDRFDPLRFTPEQVRGRHKYAWVPFGGGAHMCLGLHFAYMQAKIIFYHLLTRGRIVPGRADTRWQTWPITRPRDGLPIRYEPL